MGDALEKQLGISCNNLTLPEGQQGPNEKNALPTDIPMNRLNLSAI